MQEAMNVVVERCLFIDWQLIGMVRSPQHTICETVRQIQGGESPYFCGILDRIRGILGIPTEELHAVFVIVHADDIGADFIGNPCSVAAGGKLHAIHALPIYNFCCMHHQNLTIFENSCAVCVCIHYSIKKRICLCNFNKKAGTSTNAFGAENSHSPNSAAFLPDATGQCDLEFIVSFQKKKIS